MTQISSVRKPAEVASQANNGISLFSRSSAAPSRAHLPPQQASLLNPGPQLPAPGGDPSNAGAGVGSDDRSHDMTGAVPPALHTAGLEDFEEEEFDDDDDLSNLMHMTFAPSSTTSLLPSLR